MARSCVAKMPTASAPGKASQVREALKQGPGKLHAGCYVYNETVMGRKLSCCREMTQTQFKFWLAK